MTVNKDWTVFDSSVKNCPETMYNTTSEWQEVCGQIQTKDVNFLPRIPEVRNPTLAGSGGRLLFALYDAEEAEMCTMMKYGGFSKVLQITTTNYE